MSLGKDFCGKCGNELVSDYPCPVCKRKKYEVIREVTIRISKKAYKEFQQSCSEHMFGDKNNEHVHPQIQVITANDESFSKIVEILLDKSI